MNKYLIAFIVSAYVLLCPMNVGARPPHAFHTSLAQINYDAKAKVLEVSLRVFTDDLELALSKESNRKIKLDDTNQQDRLLETYVKKQFGLTDQKGQQKTIHFIGKEFEVDATWIYLEVPCNESINGFSVRNAILTDVFDDQTNVVNLTYLTVKKTFLFKGDNLIQLIAL
ncbi:MAG: DUF6702 family protein [Bacteroidota bacterium]